MNLLLYLQVIINRLTSALVPRHCLSRVGGWGTWGCVQVAGKCARQPAYCDTVAWYMCDSCWNRSFWISDCTEERSIVQETGKSTSRSELKTCLDLEQIPWYWAGDENSASQNCWFEVEYLSRRMKSVPWGVQLRRSRNYSWQSCRFSLRPPFLTIEKIFRARGCCFIFDSCLLIWKCPSFS